MPSTDSNAPTWLLVFFIFSLDGAWVAEMRGRNMGNAFPAANRNITESRGGSFDYRIALGRRAALLLRHRERRQTIENRGDGKIRPTCD
jgi:hypothetical protein